MNTTSTQTASKAPRFSVRFVARRDEYAGRWDGGCAVEIGSVKTSDGRTYDVYSMSEARETMAELRAEHREAVKAAKKAA